jgi:hypothetical protein
MGSRRTRLARHQRPEQDAEWQDGSQERKRQSRAGLLVERGSVGTTARFGQDGSLFHALAAICIHFLNPGLRMPAAREGTTRPEYLFELALDDQFRRVWSVWVAPSGGNRLETRVIRELDERCPRCNKKNLQEVEAVGFDESGEPYRFARCPGCSWAQPLSSSS